jgi:hypothetical protein
MPASVMLVGAKSWRCRSRFAIRPLVSSGPERPVVTVDGTGVEAKTTRLRCPALLPASSFPGTRLATGGPALVGW